MQALQTLTADIRQLLIRTQSMLVGSLVLAPIILVIQFGPQIIHILETGSGLNENYAGQVTSDYILMLLKKASDYSLSKTLIVVILWAMVGVIAYFVCTSFIRWVLSVKDEVAIDTNAEKSSVGKSLVVHLGKKLLVMLLFGGFVAISLVFLIPYCMDLVQIFMYDMNLENSSLLILGILSLTFTIYVVWSFAYLTWVYEETV